MMERFSVTNYYAEHTATFEKVPSVAFDASTDDTELLMRCTHCNEAGFIGGFYAIDVAMDNHLATGKHLKSTASGEER